MACSRHRDRCDVRQSSGELFAEPNRFPGVRGVRLFVGPQDDPQRQARSQPGTSRAGRTGGGGIGDRLFIRHRGGGWRIHCRALHGLVQREDAQRRGNVGRTGFPHCGCWDHRLCSQRTSGIGTYGPALHVGIHPPAVPGGLRGGQCSDGTDRSQIGAQHGYETSEAGLRVHAFYLGRLYGLACACCLTTSETVFGRHIRPCATDAEGIVSQDRVARGVMRVVVLWEGLIRIFTG